MTLMSCDVCGIVFKDLFSRSSRLHFLFETDKKGLFEELEKKKDSVYSYYGDIEQEIECFIKYCPICAKVNYFTEVKLG